MPVSQTTIENILRAYSQHAKSGRGTSIQESDKGPSFADTLQSSMTTQRRKRLEQLALENMAHITRKHPSPSE